MNSTPFAPMLTGGHPNSLGRTEEVVGIVLASHTRLGELVETVFDSDELVRMRAGDALEKVCRERPEWLVTLADRVIGEIGRIDQPSVQWHTAQILDRIRGDLGDDQLARSVELLKGFLTESNDWIVLNTTMSVLAGWAGGDPELAQWLRPQLQKLSSDPRKSVAKRASKLLAN